jgi:hypothetical protein
MRLDDVRQTMLAFVKGGGSARKAASLLCLSSILATRKMSPGRSRRTRKDRRGPVLPDALCVRVHWSAGQANQSIHICAKQGHARVGRKTQLPPEDSLVRTADQLRRNSLAFLGEAPRYHYSTAAGRLLGEKLLRHPNTCRRLTHHFRAGHVEIDIDGMTFRWPDSSPEWTRALARFAALLLAPPPAAHTHYAWSLFAAADALAPHADFEAKLTLAGLGFLLGWADVRRSQRVVWDSLRIPTAPT